MRILISIAAALIAAAAVHAEPLRIVSLDGGTTETLFALGVGDSVVARDSGSTYPEAAKKLTEIGYGHQINIESVLGMKPTLVVGRDRAMSEPSMHLLEQARVKVLRLDDKPGPEAAKARIVALGKAVDREERAKELVAAIDADLAKLAEKQARTAPDAKPRVLIVYLRPGTTMLMGEDSNAAAMVNLAGGAPALPGLKGYKDMNAEAVVAARPDVIVCYAEGLAATGGPEALWKRPGLAETPAGRNKRLIVMDDLLLAGFGPRTGEAANELFDRLHESRSASSTPLQAGGTALAGVTLPGLIPPRLRGGRGGSFWHLLKHPQTSDLYHLQTCLGVLKVLGVEPEFSPQLSSTPKQVWRWHYRSGVWEALVSGTVA